MGFVPNDGVGVVVVWSGQAEFPCVNVGGLSAVEYELVAFITGPRNGTGLSGECGGASLVEQWGKAELNRLSARSSSLKA